MGIHRVCVVWEPVSCQMQNPEFSRLGFELIFRGLCADENSALLPTIQTFQCFHFSCMLREWRKLLIPISQLGALRGGGGEDRVAHREQSLARFDGGYVLVLKPETGHLAQNRKRRSVREGIVLEQVMAPSWLHRLKRQVPQWAIGHDQQTCYSRELGLRRLYKKLEQLQRRWAKLQIAE